MDRVGWTHERNNCERWSSLDPDLLVIVAKHCDATSVCRLGVPGGALSDRSTWLILAPAAML